MTCCAPSSRTIGVVAPLFRADNVPHRPLLSTIKPSVRKRHRGIAAPHFGSLAHRTEQWATLKPSAPCWPVDYRRASCRCGCSLSLEMLAADAGPRSIADVFVSTKKGRGLMFYGTNPACRTGDFLLIFFLNPNGGKSRPQWGASDERQRC
jgi:hypothetical protein